MNFLSVFVKSRANLWKILPKIEFRQTCPLPPPSPGKWCCKWSLGSSFHFGNGHDVILCLYNLFAQAFWPCLFVSHTYFPMNINQCSHPYENAQLHHVHSQSGIKFMVVGITGVLYKSRWSLRFSSDPEFWLGQGSRFKTPPCGLLSWKHPMKQTQPRFREIHNSIRYWCDASKECRQSKSQDDDVSFVVSFMIISPLCKNDCQAMPWGNHNNIFRASEHTRSMQWCYFFFCIPLLS